MSRAGSHQAAEPETRDPRPFCFSQERKTRPDRTQIDEATNRVLQAILEDYVALSRELFAAPTQYYKAGVVFLAWLNGHQRHFSMADGMESARSVVHYAEVFRKADAAGALVRPELAHQRMSQFLALNAGIDNDL